MGQQAQSARPGGVPVHRTSLRAIVALAAAVLANLAMAMLAYADGIDPNPFRFF